jgi:hypothetical protein
VALSLSVALDTFSSAFFALDIYANLRLFAVYEKGHLVADPIVFSRLYTKRHLLADLVSAFPLPLIIFFAVVVAAAESRRGGEGLQLHAYCRLLALTRLWRLSERAAAAFRALERFFCATSSPCWRR